MLLTSVATGTPPGKSNQPTRRFATAPPSETRNLRSTISLFRRPLVSELDSRPSGLAMATQSNGIQHRTRTKTAPSFPRERQLSQQHQQQPQPLQQQPHLGQAYFLPPNPQYLPSHQRSDVDGWCLQSLQSAPMSGPPRRSSRGPRTASPTRSVDSQGRVFTWDQSAHYPPRQNFRRKSVTSNTSSSDHHTLLRSPHPSRSPSPGTPRTSLSPRALRTPATVHEYNKRTNNHKMTGQSNGGSSAASGCRFETALVNSRRRIPYSVGSDTLTVVPPGSYLAKLDEKDERCLTVDIWELYHVCSSHAFPNCSNSCRPRRPKRDASFSSINLTRFYGGSFLIAIQKFMCLDLRRTGSEPTALMVRLPPACDADHSRCMRSNHGEGYG